MEIQFENVSKSFTRKRNDREEHFVALRPTTFTVKSGEFFSIIGPSGCGKSTLLNLLAGLETADEGRVVVDGRPVDHPGADRTVVFQEHGLMPWMTVLRNVEYGLKLKGVPSMERRDRAMKYLRMVHLTRFAGSMPHQLSGGMRQRVAIARALALEPSVLLMDEPFSALDAQTRDLLHDELQRIWAETKTTVVFVTHNIREAAYLSDRILTMTGQPGGIKRIVDVPFPHPRAKSSTELSRFTAELHQEIKEEVDRVAMQELDEDWNPLTSPKRPPRDVIAPGEGI
ncbi:ABC transporter ATP-binding protein [Candidatus Sumerlaeota bacterium]|nr:ABC transporter ATP-binding protein [Candidatus Sumerlaeota bacterium]